MVLCSLNNGKWTKIEPAPYPDSISGEKWVNDLGPPYRLREALGEDATEPARSQDPVCRNCWACSYPDVYLARRPSAMKPGPVAEHLGRPPSRVPLCSDSGPLWSRGAGLKVEPLETLPPHPTPPPPAPGSHGPSCAWVASVQVHGWRSEVGPPGSQLGWKGEEGSRQDGLLKQRLLLMELSKEETGPPVGQSDTFTIPTTAKYAPRI